MSVDEDQERAEAEKVIRVGLKHAGYGYDRFFDEMTGAGMRVALQADDDTYTVELHELMPDVARFEIIAVARFSRYSDRALDRAARQVRAQLEVEDQLPPWDGA